MENIISPQERIKKIVEMTGLKRYELAMRIGVSGGMISHIMSPTGRHADMTENMARRIVQGFPELRLSYEWVLTGEGAMQETGTRKQPTLFDHAEEVVGAVKEVAAEYGGEKKEEEKVEEKVGVIKEEVKENVVDEGVKVEEKVTGKVVEERRLERIVMFYSDGTFVEYRPGE